jgi:NADPH-dependent FMN reductase
VPGPQAVVVGLGGSLRQPSRSLAALKIAIEAAEHAGATVRLFDVRALDLPFFVPRSDPPPAAQKLADAVFEAARPDLEQPDVPRHDQRRVQERARLAGPALGARSAVTHRQGRRPDQRGGRRPGPSGREHDGVRRAVATRVRRPARRSDRGTGRLRRGRVEGAQRSRIAERPMRSLHASAMKAAASSKTSRPPSEYSPVKSTAPLTSRTR